MKRWLLLFLLLLLFARPAAADLSPNELHVYGPGGPYQAMQACAEIFSDKHGIEVEVIRALPHMLAERLPVDGDVYYGGAEYMLEEIVATDPDLLDLATVEMLHPRRLGIIVRSGNPLNITCVNCLNRDEVDILDVKLENMRGFHSSTEELNPNLRNFVYTGQQGLAEWRADASLDAWVTYRTWHKSLADGSEFIEIPGRKGLRYTPVALTSRTEKREAALLFLSFLKSPEAEAIFREHGWH